MTAAVIANESAAVGLVLPLLAVVVSGTPLLFRRRALVISLATSDGFAAVATAMALYAVAVYSSARRTFLCLLRTGGILLPNPRPTMAREIRPTAKAPNTIRSFFSVLSEAMGLLASFHLNRPSPLPQYSRAPDFFIRQFHPRVDEEGSVAVFG